MRAIPVRPRIRINKNGTATLSGVPYSALRSILTEASLYLYDNPVVPQKLDGLLDDVVTFNNACNKNWEKNQRWLLDQLHKVMGQAIVNTHPNPAELSLKERLRQSVEMSKLLRTLFNLKKKEVE